MTSATLLLNLTRAVNANKTPGSTGTNDLADELELERVEYALDVVRLVCSQIMAPIVSTVGVTANILNVIVLTRKWMLSSTNYYLRAVAIFDILYSTIVLLLYLKLSDVMKTMNLYMYMVPILFGLGNVCSNATAWLTCTFTIERYIAVCHPMLGRKVCTRERAFWIIIIVTTASTVITIPDFLLRATLPPLNNTNEYQIVKTIYFTKLSKAGWSHIQSTLFVFIPIFLLCFFNYQLIRSVIIANRMRRKMAINICTAPMENSGSGGGNENRQSSKTMMLSSSGSGTRGLLDDRRSRQASEQQKITIMLIAVVVGFCLCQIPSVVSNTITAIHRNLRAVTYAKLKILGNISNLLLLTSAALNFFLYSCFSTKFRRTFQRVFCRCWLTSGSAGLQMVDYNSRMPGQGNSHLQEQVQ